MVKIWIDLDGNEVVTGQNQAEKCQNQVENSRTSPKISKLGRKSQNLAGNPKIRSEFPKLG